MQITYGTLVLSTPLTLRHTKQQLVGNQILAIYESLAAIFGTDKEAKFKTLNSDKAIPGTFIGFEGTHIVRVLNERGRIVRTSAAHFQEQCTTLPRGAKRQCLEPLAHLDEDFDLPFRTAWFSDPDAQDPTQQEQPSQQPTLQHQPSKTWKRDFNLRSQSLPTTVAAYAHLAITNTFAMIADMMPEEPYEPRTWVDVLRHNSREKWLQAANDEMASLIENSTWTLVDPPPN
jgi:hypothetical protein